MSKTCSSAPLTAAFALALWSASIPTPTTAVVVAILTAGAASFSGTLPAAAQPTAEDAAVEMGRRLAERMCATCHLNPGQGEKTSPAAVPGFAAVANRPGQTLGGIVSWLASVPPMMPDHRLSVDERAALAAYILSLAVEQPER